MVRNNFGNLSIYEFHPGIRGELGEKRRYADKNWILIEISENSYTGITQEWKEFICQEGFPKIPKKEEILPGPFNRDQLKKLSEIIGISDKEFFEWEERYGLIDIRNKLSEKLRNWSRKS